MLDTLREMLHKDPFRPLVIVLTSGDKVEVAHPDLVAIMKSEVFVAYPKSDRFIFIRQNQIAAIEAMAKAA